MPVVTMPGKTGVVCIQTIGQVAALLEHGRVTYKVQELFFEAGPFKLSFKDPHLAWLHRSCHAHRKWEFVRWPGHENGLVAITDMGHSIAQCIPLVDLDDGVVDVRHAAWAQRISKVVCPATAPVPTTLSQPWLPPACCICWCKTQPCDWANGPASGNRCGL